MGGLLSAEQPRTNILFNNEPNNGIQRTFMCAVVAVQTNFPFCWLQKKKKKFVYFSPLTRNSSMYVRRIYRYNYIRMYRLFLVVFSLHFLGHASNEFLIYDVRYIYGILFWVVHYTNLLLSQNKKKWTWPKETNNDPKASNNGLKNATWVMWLLLAYADTNLD